MNLLRLSQSTELFKELKMKLIKILESNCNSLGVDKFKLLLKDFNNLEEDYFDFFEFIKSKFVLIYFQNLNMVSF
jgi:hypothetical protein